MAHKCDKCGIKFNKVEQAKCGRSACPATPPKPAPEVPANPGLPLIAQVVLMDQLSS